MALKFKSGRQSHEKGLYVYFRLREIFFYLLKRQRCRVSMTKHRQQSIRVRAKGIDPIGRQVCSTLTNLVV